MNHTFRDVDAWAIETGEPKDTVRSLRRIPARLGLLDADMGSLSADPVRFEKEIAGQGYARVSCARDKKAAGRREDSRIRALLKRYHAAQVGTGLRDEALRARYSALMSVIAEHEGQPGSGALWNIGRHRSLCGLRARARKAPEDLTQTEVDRIGREMTSNKRKGLRKTVGFLNSLAGLPDEIPQLREFLPSEPLAPPVGASWARRMDWEVLPAPLRSSFETAADACLAGNDDLAEQMLARIEAGEDPEMVMAEADALGVAKASSVGKPTAARKQYQSAVAWLVRSWENEGGDTAGLTDLRSLFGRATLEAAIKDQISRSRAASDLRDPLSSGTLATRLASLTTLAGRGLEDAKALAILKLLKAQHYDVPRKKLLQSGNEEGLQMEVDRIAAKLRQSPVLATLWSNAPQRLAKVARERIESARDEKTISREITALRIFAGAVTYALQMSRPMRTRCLRHARIASEGEAHANLLRMAPGEDHYTFRFAPWEIKNRSWVTVDVVDGDADLLREWLEKWRPRMIELQKLDPKSVYLFPGKTLPKQDKGDPITLPRGCYSSSAFLELWWDASEVLGDHETPHRMRHVVALLILALRPGDYAFVSTVLGNQEDTARTHYGRDDSQAAAREARAALIAQHPDLFKNLKRRHRI